MCTLTSGSKPEVTYSEVILLAVSGVGQDNFTKLNEVLTVSRIPLKAAAIPPSAEMRLMEHLRGVTLTELPDKKVRLLIGLARNTRCY